MQFTAKYFLIDQMLMELSSMEEEHTLGQCLYLLWSGRLSRSSPLWNPHTERHNFRLSKLHGKEKNRKPEKSTSCTVAICAPQIQLAHAAGVENPRENENREDYVVRTRYNQLIRAGAKLD